MFIFSKIRNDSTVKMTATLAEQSGGGEYMFAHLIASGAEGVIPVKPGCFGPGNYPTGLGSCCNGYFPENEKCTFGNV